MVNPKSEPLELTLIVTRNDDTFLVNPNSEPLQLALLVNPYN